MAQTIKLKRGLESARSLITPATGEIIYTTDNLEIFLGDGATAGGTEIGYLNKRLGGTIGGNLTVTGNLTVNGTTTSVNSNEVNIGDNIIILNALYAGSTPSASAGFEVERGTLTNTSLLWNEGVSEWQLTDTVGTRRILDTNDILSAGTGISISAGVVTNTDRGSSQNIFKSVTGDTGTITAGSNSDTFKIAGGNGITTSVSGNILTITGTTYGAASTTTAGIVELATQAETEAVTDGTRAVTPLALAGLKSAIDANTAKVSNVSTNLSYTASPTNGIVVSSDGNNATIPLATGTNAGLLAPADFTKLGNIASNADNYSSWTIAGDTGSEAVLSGQTLTIAGGGDTTTAYDAGTNTLTISTSATVQFTGLTDTPASYTGQGTKLVAVNATETALEFVDVIDGGTF